jgi:hypothetical protein
MSSELSPLVTGVDGGRSQTGKATRVKKVSGVPGSGLGLVDTTHGIAGRSAKKKVAATPVDGKCPHSWRR